MSSIARKSAENFAARLISQAFSIGGAIVIARVLGPSGKGEFSYAATVLAMLQMFNAGQASAISWQYAKRGREPLRLLRAMLKILAIVALPAGAVLAALALLVPAQRALLPVAFTLPFALFAQSATGFFLADSDVRTINVQQLVIGAAAVTVYVPLLLVLHAGLWVLFAVWGCGYVAAAIYSAIRLRPYARGDATDASDAAVIKEQLAYGGQVSLNSAVQYLNFRIDVLLIMVILGQTALGIYSIAVGIGELLWQLSRPMATAAFGSIARGTEREAADVTAACMRHSFALVSLGAVAVFFAVPPLVPLVYGAKFAHAGIVARALLPGMIAYSMMPTLAAFFAQQLGRPRIPLVFSTLSTVICAGATVLLLPRVGIIGGAIATSLSYCIAFTAAAIYFVRRTHIAPRRMFTLTRSDLAAYQALLSRKSFSSRG